MEDDTGESKPKRMRRKQHDLLGEEWGEKEPGGDRIGEDDWESGEDPHVAPSTPLPSSGVERTTRYPPTSLLTTTITDYYSPIRKATMERMTGEEGQGEYMELELDDSWEAWADSCADQVDSKLELPDMVEGESKNTGEERKLMKEDDSLMKEDDWPESPETLEVLNTIQLVFDDKDDMLLPAGGSGTVTQPAVEQDDSKGEVPDGGLLSTNPDSRDGMTIQEGWPTAPYVEGEAFYGVGPAGGFGREVGEGVKTSQVEYAAGIHCETVSDGRMTTSTPPEDGQDSNPAPTTVPPVEQQLLPGKPFTFPSNDMLCAASVQPALPVLVDDDYPDVKTSPGETPPDDTHQTPFHSPVEDYLLPGPSTRPVTPPPPTQEAVGDQELSQADVPAPRTPDVIQVSTPAHGDGGSGGGARRAIGARVRTPARPRCQFLKGGVCKEHGAGAKRHWKPIIRTEIGPGGVARAVSGRKYFYECDLDLSGRRRMSQSRLSFSQTPGRTPVRGGDDTLQGDLGSDDTSKEGQSTAGAAEDGC